MTRQVSILKAGPGITCQDRGRPGYLAYGLSRGGAADILALSEGAALLGQSPDLGAIVAENSERFEADIRQALGPSAS